MPIYFVQETSSRPIHCQTKARRRECVQLQTKTTEFLIFEYQGEGGQTVSI